MNNSCSDGSIVPTNNTHIKKKIFFISTAYLIKAHFYFVLRSLNIVDQKNNFRFWASISFAEECASLNEHNMMQGRDCIHCHVKPILPPVQNQTILLPQVQYGHNYTTWPSVAFDKKLKINLPRPILLSTTQNTDSLLMCNSTSTMQFYIQIWNVFGLTHKVQFYTSV